MLYLILFEQTICNFIKQTTICNFIKLMTICNFIKQTTITISSTVTTLILSILHGLQCQFIMHSNMAILLNLVAMVTLLQLVESTKQPVIGRIKCIYSAFLVINDALFFWDHGLELLLFLAKVLFSVDKPKEKIYILNKYYHYRGRSNQ